MDSKLVKNINEAEKAMAEANQEELNKKNVSMTRLGITPPPVISKKKSLKCLTEESEKDRKSCQTGKIRQINENIKTLYIYQQHRDIIDYHVNIFFH